MDEVPAATSRRACLRPLGCARENTLTRRRSARFEFSPSAPGCFRTATDVRLTDVQGNAVQALSRTPGVEGECGVLEFVDGGRRMTVRVRIGESRPVVTGGSIRFQLTLVFLQPVLHERAPAGEPE